MKFYQDKTKTDFQVGLFTLIGLIILILAYFWLTEILENRNYTELRVAFDNAGNTEIGSPVTINGVKQGRVESIQVQQSGVILLLKVKLDFPLKSDTQVYILESSLMSDIQVEIKPGTSEELLDTTALLQGKREIGFTRLVSQLGDILLGMQNLIMQISGDKNLLTDIKTIMDETKSVMQKLNSTLDHNDDKIETLIANASAISVKLNKLITDNQDDISQTISQSAELVADIDRTIQAMQSITADLQTISQKMLQEDNSFNKLITEEDLYDNLLKATAHMDSLLTDIQKNPQKYFKVKVF
ncbi:MAG TPA: MlaD family protein [Candidatus Cloacimonadota bacterium]|nr:MlaD family protein [Candidatus Cloacimonadota bacterium]